MSVRRAGWAATTAVVVALAASAGEPARMAWSTYLRAGPGQGFAALDEVEHDTPVRVRGCAGGWCRVAVERVVGYVDRDALALPRAPAVKVGGPARCVVADQPSSRRPEPTRFCTPR